MKKTISLAFALALFAVPALAQQYDYQVKRGSLANYTPQQITDELNAMSLQGWDVYAAVPEIHTGDTITVFRRPHIAAQ